MRLSDAMMLGATLIKHIDDVSDNGDYSQGCALQCAVAAHGVNGHNFDYPWEFVVAKFPWTLGVSCCPACEQGESKIERIIGHINDCHKWPIERIADWVRSVDPQEPAETETPVAEVEHALTRA